MVLYWCSDIVLTLAVIEFLPAELKSRFLQIRDLDDHVQSTMTVSLLHTPHVSQYLGQLESLNDRTKTFFTLCRKNSKPELREQQYQNLCQVWSHMHDVNRHVSSTHKNNPCRSMRRC